MQTITIGLDIAKSVFQLHGEDGTGGVVQQAARREGNGELVREASPLRGGARGLRDVALLGPHALRRSGARCGFCRRPM